MSFNKKYPEIYLLDCPEYISIFSVRDLEFFSAIQYHVILCISNAIDVNYLNKQKTKT